MAEIKFTLGNKSIIAVKNSPLAGKLRVSQSFGAPVEFPYDLTQKGRTYAQHHMGKLIGNDPFPFNAAIAQGWTREGLNVYKDGALMPNYATYTEADPWTDCMGSAAYEQQFLTQNKGVRSGVNLAQKGYRVNNISKAALGGNDIFTVRRDSKGRLYTAILYNDARVALPGDAGAVMNCPMLFYSDDEGQSWCQYWSPYRSVYPDNVRLSDGTRSGYRGWNGDFWIFSKDTQLLGKSFKADSVLWIICNFRPPVSGVQTQGAQIIYMVQPDPQSAPSEYGVLVDNSSGGGGMAGDPRFNSNPENGSLDFVSNGDSQSLGAAYTRFQMRNWSAGTFSASIYLKPIAQKPPVGQWNYEVPCPILGTNLFLCNIQLVNVGSSWNSIVNATVLVDDGNLDNYKTVDIGYDSYALGNGDGKLMLTVMNWGSNNYGFVASYPPRPFTVEGGKLRFSTDGFLPISGDHQWKCGGVPFIRLADTGGKLECIPIADDYLTWGAKWRTQPHHALRSLPDMADVAGVYYKTDGFMLYMIIKCKSGHDRLCNVYCTKGNITL